MPDRAADPCPHSGFREGDNPLGSAALASSDRHAQTRLGYRYLTYNAILKYAIPVFSVILLSLRYVAHIGKKYFVNISFLTVPGARYAAVTEPS